MPKFNPPDPMDFSRPNEWPEWKQFTRYRIASKLNQDSGEVQVAALVYSMGKEAENIFKSFGLTAEDEKNYDTVLEKFEGHFVPKTNTIHERAKFHQRKQNNGESVETFIRSLYELSEKCAYEDKRNEQIRDKLVIGLLDKELSEELQLQTDLTLETAVTMARQSEMVKSQVKSQTSHELDEIRGQNKQYSKWKPRPGPKPNKI